MPASARLIREEKTVNAMIRLYCRAHHAPAAIPCAECQALMDYAHARLEKCPYQADKPTCANCPIHCYRPDRRETMRAVMRYAGPRMLWRHPWLAVSHLLEGRKKAPELPRKKHPNKPNLEL